jgi:hypothetical protein
MEKIDGSWFQYLARVLIALATAIQEKGKVVIRPLAKIIGTGFLAHPIRSEQIFCGVGLLPAPDSELKRLLQQVY